MSGPVGELRAAAALLTRLPAAAPVGAAPAGAGAAAFPVVGLGIGLLAAVPVLVIGASEPTLAAIAALTVSAIVTGGLHLDGLADTTDALMAPDPVRAEAARRDPRIGSGGVIALVLVLGAEVAALAGSAASAGAALAAAVLVTAMTVARLLPLVVALAEGRRARTADPDGSGAWFARQVTAADVGIAALIAAVVGVAASVITAAWLPLAAAGLGFTVASAAAVAVRHARGRLDGDGLGAATELAIVSILASAAVLGG